MGPIDAAAGSVVAGPAVSVPDDVRCPDGGLGSTPSLHQNTHPLTAEAQGIGGFPVVPEVGGSIVEFKGVSRAYGSRLALDDVDLALDPGALTFLVGPSGAGKTTLLKLINREIRPTKGEVWVDGIAAHKIKASRVSELRRRVGVVFQDYKLLPRLTAKENVALALQVVDLRVSDEEASERAIDALGAVGLRGRGESFPDQLSGGQQQRGAVARAVVAQPPLLIADELGRAHV